MHFVWLYLAASHSTSCDTPPTCSFPCPWLWRPQASCLLWTQGPGSGRLTGARLAQGRARCCWDWPLPSTAAPVPDATQGQGVDRARTLSPDRAMSCSPWWRVFFLSSLLCRCVECMHHRRGAWLRLPVQSLCTQTFQVRPEEPVCDDHWCMCSHTGVCFLLSAHLGPVLLPVRSELLWGEAVLGAEVRSCSKRSCLATGTWLPAALVCSDPHSKQIGRFFPLYSVALSELHRRLEVDSLPSSLLISNSQWAEVEQRAPGTHTGCAAASQLWVQYVPRLLDSQPDVPTMSGMYENSESSWRD